MAQSAQIPVFLINLARSSDRLKIVEASASESGISLTRVEAVDGCSVPKNEWIDVDIPEFERRNGRELLPGEYGCYRSHIRALEAFCETGQPYGVVLEDDVRLDDRFLGRIAAMIEADSGFDVIKLVNHRSVGFVHLVTTQQGDELGRTCFGPQGSAAAYLVSREGAQKLLRNLRIMVLPWDVAMEQYWRSDADLLSARSNILSFSELRSKSSIVVDHEGTKFSPIHRVPAFLSRMREHYERFFRSAAGLPNNRVAALHPDEEQGPGLYSSLISGLAVLLFISAIWTESDVYRYAGVFLVGWALYGYFRREVWTYSRQYIGYAGLFCILWALYAGGRMAYDLVVNPESGMGSSEGIYMLTLLYPTFGYALWRFCRRPFPIVVSAMAISFFALLASTNFAEIVTGSQEVSIAHNNTIHAANACGFMLIFAICFADHVSVRTDLDVKMKTGLLLLAAAVGGLALLNIITFGSKGVWLAMFVVLPFLAASMIFRDWRLKRTLSVRSMTLAASILLAGTVGVSVFMPQLEARGGETLGAALPFVESALSEQGLMSTLEAYSTSSNVPGSMRERLMLWSSALEIWTEHLWFGAGVGWLSIWKDSTSPIIERYNLFHNGYLELLVRYGLVGLAAYGFMLAYATRKVYQAASLGLVGRSTFVCYSASVVFFLLGILTNSNIRLAIGESFLWFAVGFGFYCSFLLQEKGIGRPKSWI